MRRREFVRLLTGSAVFGPCTVLAQQPSRIYRLGSLNTAGPLNEANPNGKILLAALAQRGYSLGRNLSYDARGAMGDVAKIRQHMAELKEQMSSRRCRWLPGGRGGQGLTDTDGNSLGSR